MKVCLPRGDIIGYWGVKGQVNMCSTSVWLHTLSEKNKHRQGSRKEIKVHINKSSEPLANFWILLHPLGHRVGVFSMTRVLWCCACDI